MIKTGKETRIIFMGTPEFAVPSIDILVTNGYNVVAVITSTDKYGGRGGKKLIESPIKKYALKNDIPLLQPKNLKSPAFIEELKSFHADLQVVVAFRMLPVIVWDMPRLGTINLHGSLLPKYRGAAPINWAIINGESETGVTSFKLKHEIDTGDIILQEKISIENNDDAGTVHDKMMYVGADVILKTVEKIIASKVEYTPQDKSLVCKAPKIYHQDCEIDFSLDCEYLYNFIRGLSPYPGAWFNIIGQEIKVFKCSYEIASHDINYGSYITNNKTYFKIFCKNGIISLEDIKMQGKKRMEIKSFLNGNTIV